MGINAQDSKFLFGFEFMPNFTSVRDGSYISEYTESVQSFSGGFTLDYFLQSKLSLRLALTYEKKGYKEGLETASYYVTKEKFENLRYLVVPLTVILSTGTNKRQLTFYAELGAFYGYLLSAEEKIVTETYPSTTVKTKEKNTSEFRRRDFGLSLGLGFMIPIGKRFYTDLSVQDNIGLLAINKDPDDWYGEMKTNSFAVQIGVKYKL